MKGKMKFFNREKGFGFIAGEDGKEYFVHKTGVNEGITLNDNDSVTFDVTEGDRGLKAVNVSKDAAGSGDAQSE
ncbi:cold shock domain-containing protein [Candidatus Woesearchaeota archaeon]|nr:cold shock domain-containing protein [Candidatus Woesearchaeota archaeon]